MPIKIHFTGYRSAHLQIHNCLIVHTYYNPKDTRKNKNKYNVILKIRFHRPVRVAEGSNDKQGTYLEGFRTGSSDGCSS